jgi:hypothetical protein
MNDKEAERAKDGVIRRILQTEILSYEDLESTARIIYDAGYEAGKAAAREGEVDASGLLPCPFCGGTATSEREDEIGFVTVRCSTEGCILDNMAINPMSWNRRDK